jgi:regulatory protein
VRARGRIELARDLARRGFQPEAVASALDRLTREGWLDDLAAARSLIRGKSARYGRRRLQRELAARGFSQETVAAALSELDRETEEESLKKAFDRLWNATHGVPTAQRRARIARALARRGFPGDAISAMIRSSHEVD